MEVTEAHSLEFLASQFPGVLRGCGVLLRFLGDMGCDLNLGQWGWLTQLEVLQCLLISINVPLLSCDLNLTIEMLTQLEKVLFTVEKREEGEREVEE
ncbi:hypothetical protein Tco_0622762, partial [Tanacetum coccineum]